MLNGNQASYNQTEFDFQIKKCKFEQRIANCSINASNGSEQSYHDSYFDLSDLKTGLEQAKVYLIEYLEPLVSFMGLITKVIIILTIIRGDRVSKRNNLPYKNSEGIQLKQQFFKCMLLNSILNASYCLFFIFKFAIVCTPISYNDDLNKNNCLAKEIVINGISSILKIASNLSYIQMSVTRYILIGKDHGQLIAKLSNTKIKKFVLVTFVLSVLLCIVIFFQQSFFNSTEINGLKIFKSSGSLYYWDGTSYRDVERTLMENKIDRDTPILFAFTIIHDLFSYVLFNFASIAIDIMTVKKTKADLD
jgi:hypothetical protein